MPAKYDSNILLTGILFIIMLFAGAATMAQKTDVVIMRNDDKITGEVKSLEFGILKYSTDDMGTLSIEWDKIKRLVSGQIFEIEMASGTLYYGSLIEPENDFMLRISGGPAFNDVRMINVVMITPIRNRFWTRLSGSIDLGFNYTKASDVSQLNASFGIKYRARKNMVNISYSGTFTTQAQNPNSYRQDLSTLYFHSLKNKWFAGGILSGQQNSELGIDLRTSLGAAGGRKFIQTNHVYLHGVIGPLVNREWSRDTSLVTTNAEAFLGGEFSVFKYDSPKSDITLGSTLFASLNDWGRIRSEVDLKARQEVFSDFYVSLTFYLSFDNRPPSATRIKNDWGVTFSLGWSFN